MCGKRRGEGGSGSLFCRAKSLRHRNMAFEQAVIENAAATLVAGRKSGGGGGRGDIRQSVGGTRDRRRD
jgi:hypothetical protein